MGGNFFVIGTFLLGSLLFFTSQIKMSGIVKAVAYSGLVIIYALAGFLFDSPASILIGIPYLITLVSWLFYKANKQVRIAIVAILILGGLGSFFGGSTTTSSSSSTSISSGKGDPQKQKVIMGCSNQCKDFKDKDLRQNCFQTCINLNGK